MKENAKPDGARATSAEAHAQSSAPPVRATGARFATTALAKGDMNGRVEIIRYWAPSRSDQKPPMGGWSKRAFDVVVSAGALILFAPLLLLIALIIRLDSRGPAIFRQERGGFNGKPFLIWKFRTMTVMENRGIVQARPGDVRFTRLGAFLRGSSLDELPQLVNVLRGDMSIIGPRPHALEHDAKFEKVDPRYPMRFDARPGLTGLAQVSGSRGPTPTDEKIVLRTGHDIEYVQAWSWRRDLKILWRTIVVLVRGAPDAL